MTKRKTVFERQPDFTWKCHGLPDQFSFNEMLMALESMCGERMMIDLLEITGKSEILHVFKDFTKALETEVNGVYTLIVYRDLGRTAFSDILKKTLTLSRRVEAAVEEGNCILEAQKICKLIAKTLDQTLEPKFVHIRHPLLVK